MDGRLEPGASLYRKAATSEHISNNSRQTQRAIEKDIGARGRRGTAWNGRGSLKQGEVASDALDQCRRPTQLQHPARLVPSLYISPIHPSPDPSPHPVPPHLLKHSCEFQGLLVLPLCVLSTVSICPHPGSSYSGQCPLCGRLHSRHHADMCLH